MVFKILFDILQNHSNCPENLMSTLNIISTAYIQKCIDLDKRNLGIHITEIVLFIFILIFLILIHLSQSLAELGSKSLS